MNQTKKKGNNNKNGQMNERNSVNACMGDCRRHHRRQQNENRETNWNTKK